DLRPFGAELAPQVRDTVQTEEARMVRGLLAIPMLLIIALSLPAHAIPSISITQCANSGDPSGHGLQIILHGGTAGDFVAFGLVNITFSYNPAPVASGGQGPITSIDTSVDKNLTISQSNPFNVSFNNGFRPLIEQDGKFYMASVDVTLLDNTGG